MKPKSDRKRLISIALLVMFASVACAQASSSSRLEAIDNAIDSRLSTQLDVWFEDGNFPVCIQLLKVQAELATKDYDVWTNLGWMQENVEDYSDAEKTYRRFLENNPRYPDRSLALADFYFRRKQYKRVPALLEPVLNEKVHANVFRTLGHAYDRLNRLQDSLRVWKKYVARHPEDLSGKANLNRVLKKLERAKPGTP